MLLFPAIERHRRQLTRIVATLFAMIGLVEGSRVDRLSPSVYRKVLRVLQPAESAVRRLIVVMARGLEVKPSRARGAREARVTSVKGKVRAASFKLFDPRQRFSSAFAHERGRGPRLKPVRRPEPRLRVIDVGFDPRVPLFRRAPVIVKEPPPLPLEGTVNALRLCRRLAAIRSALEDLPRQARRYARWQAKPSDKRRPQFASALRRGPPPGHRKNPVHKVDEILAQCHWLALRPSPPDSS